MVNLTYYNPCRDRVKYLESILMNRINISKQIKVKYDNENFFTNVLKQNIENYDFLHDEEYFFSGGNLLVFKVESSFFERNIALCPEIELQYIDDLYLEGILKRMYSQIEFGYFTDDFFSIDSIEICDKIFKSIYTKSLSVKIKNIKSSLEIFDKLQKTKYINKKIIYALIYAIYEYYNQTLK